MILTKYKYTTKSVFWFSLIYFFLLYIKKVSLKMPDEQNYYEILILEENEIVHSTNFFWDNWFETSS